MRNTVVVSLLLLILSFTATSATAQGPDQPSAPFRVIGNIYYVGTRELAAFLVATPAGHVLVDGGYESTGPLVLASIRQLGFDPADLRVLLTTQAHFDHVGSLKTFVDVSRARVMVMTGDADAVERGGRGDFALRDAAPFPPVRVDRVLHDGDTVSLGGTTLVARRTPGHTRGCTTWATEVTENGQRLHVTIAGSLAILDTMRLVNDPSYPDIASDFAQSIATLRSLPTDVFLAAHARVFDLEGKARRLRRGEKPHPFIDRAGFRRYLDGAQRALNERLAKERSVK